MKDIYSPLDIDEEWDNMEPMVDAPTMGSADTATAVEVKSNENTAMDEMKASMPETSTLPPAPANEIGEGMNAESNSMDLNNPGLKEDTASQDAAYDVANSGMEAAMGDNKLNLEEIKPKTETELPTDNMNKMDLPDNLADNSKIDKEPTSIPVIDMDKAAKELKDNNNQGEISVGKSFAPSEKPDTDLFADMPDIENSVIDKEPTNTMPENPSDMPAKNANTKQATPPPAPELPVSPAAEEDNNIKELSKFGDEDKMKFDMGEEPSGSKEISGSRLESLMGEWEAMKKRTQDRLNDLRKEKDAMLSKLEQELKETEDKIAATEAERDDIDAKLNELM